MSSCGALLLFLALLGLPETSHFNREKCVNPSFLACYFLNKAQMCIAPVYSELIRHEIEIPQNAICWRWSCHLSLFFVNAFICTGCMSSPRRPLWGCHLPPLVLNWLVSSLLSGCLSLTRPNKIDHRRFLGASRLCRVFTRVRKKKSSSLYSLIRENVHIHYARASSTGTARRGAPDLRVSGFRIKVQLTVFLSRMLERQKFWSMLLGERGFLSEELKRIKLKE